MQRLHLGCPAENPVIQPRILIAMLSTAALSACIVSPYPYRQPAYYPQAQAQYQARPEYQQPYQSSVVVDVAPPAPYVEVVPPMPFLGALWIAGFWGWDGGHHRWNAGHYEHSREGYSYRPHAWVQQGGQWHMHPGGWERR